MSVLFYFLFCVHVYPVGGAVFSCSMFKVVGYGGNERERECVCVCVCVCVCERERERERARVDPVWSSLACLGGRCLIVCVHVAHLLFLFYLSCVVFFFSFALSVIFSFSCLPLFLSVSFSPPPPPLPPPPPPSPLVMIVSPTRSLHSIHSFLHSFHSFLPSLFHSIIHLQAKAKAASELANERIPKIKK